MSEKDLENKIKNILKILELIHLYRNDFLNKLGSEKALKIFIDDVLDEINDGKKQLKNLRNE